MHSEPKKISRRFVLRRTLESLATSLYGGSILGKAAAWMIGTLSVCFTYLGIRFLWPARPARLGEWIRLGRIDEMPSGEVDTAWVHQWGIYLIRWATPEGETIAALRVACTHLGCMTHWDAALRQFVCPCHGSAFDMEGKRLRGPARRPLERCAVRLRDGLVEVNLRRTIPQQSENWPSRQSHGKNSAEPM